MPICSLLSSNFLPDSSEWFASNDSGHIVILHIVDIGGTWGDHTNGPRVRMSFPVSGNEDINLHD
jgi:hypothetical protein